MTMADHLSHNLYTAPGAELSEIALGLRAGRPLETARRIMATTHESLRYVRGVTSVHTSAGEAYTDGAGVCQDFAHLALAFTKSVGLPSTSRATSTRMPTQPSARRSRGRATRGWKVRTGRWWAYDPTNDCPVGERHVAVGRGRDYGDVPPTGQGHLRQRREHHAGGGAHGEGPLSVANPD